MDYRHTTKSKRQLRLGAKRKKHNKIKFLQTANKRRNDISDILASDEAEIVEDISSSLPSTSGVSSSSTNIQSPIYTPGTYSILNDRKRKLQNKKLSLSEKRKKKTINIGLLNYNINRRRKTQKNNPNTNYGDNDNTLQNSVTARSNEMNVDVYNFNLEFENLEPLASNPPQSLKEVDQRDLVSEITPPNLPATMNETVYHLASEICGHDASKDDAINSISGRFIIDGQHFFRAIRALENHRYTCLKSTKGYFKLISWNMKLLVWTLNFQCPYCKISKIVTSEPSSNAKVSCENTQDGHSPPASSSTSQISTKNSSTSPQKLSQLSTADSAVWGFMAIGGGHSNMEEVFSTIGLKCIDEKCFRRIETKLGQVWQELLFETMIEAGKEEKALAIAAEQVTHDGVPFITVVVDGGWSHRSHGHRFDSNSGVACVIGARTKKLLHLEVRNKYCAMCLYLKKNKESENHANCFKNWNGSSCAMEPDILVNAFNQSTAIHGLEYRRFIGDGDSSVQKKLREMVTYGRHIEKIECANHVIKNYTKALMKIQGVSRAIRSVLTRPVVKRLAKGARSAIIYNAKHGQDPNALKEDLRNGPFHIFSIHKNCKTYFCSEGDKESALTVAQLDALKYAQECVKPLVRKAHQLVTNSTSNYAENFMSLVAKFTGGKQVNRCKRGSYGYRTQGAGLDFQLGPSWLYNSMKSATGKSPSCAVKRLAQKRTKKLAATKKSLFKQPNIKKKTVRDKGAEDYGPLCQKLDMESEDLENEMTDFKNNLQVTTEEADALEIRTRGQAENELWFEERKYRLTASNFGLIAKRRTTSKWSKLVDTFLYGNKNFETVATRYGKMHEKDAIAAFTAKTGEAVSECGLFVDVEFGYLGASPDGLTSSGGIIEVKCPYVARELTIKEAITTVKGFCLDKNGKLRRNHNYYYQVQGQLHVANKPHCDFVLWTEKDMSIERIDQDKSFWAEKILPRLIFFFEKALLPEIIDPRKSRSMPIREPEK